MVDFFGHHVSILFSEQLSHTLKFNGVLQKKFPVVIFGFDVFKP